MNTVKVLAGMAAEKARYIAADAGAKVSDMNRAMKGEYPSSLQLVQEIQRAAYKKDFHAKQIIPQIVNEEELAALAEKIRAWAAGSLNGKETHDFMCKKMLRGQTKASVNYGNTLAALTASPEVVPESLAFEHTVNMTVGLQFDEVVRLLGELFGEFATLDRAWMAAAKELELLPQSEKCVKPTEKELRARFSEAMEDAMKSIGNDSCGGSHQTEVFVWLEIVRLCLCVEVLRHVAVPTSMPTLLPRQDTAGNDESSALVGPGTYYLAKSYESGSGSARRRCTTPDSKPTVSM